MSIFDDLMSSPIPEQPVTPGVAFAGGDPNDLLQRLKDQLVARYSENRSGMAVPDGQWKVTQPTETDDGARITTPAPGAAAQTQTPSTQYQTPATTTARPGPSTASPQVAPPTLPAALQPTFADRLMNFGNALQGRTPVNLDRQAAIQNLTYQALMKQGASPEVAQLAITQPEAMKQILPTLLGSQTQFVNNMLVDKRTGRIVADFRDYATTHPTADFKNPATMEDVKATFEPSIQGHVAPNGDIYSGPLIGQNIFKLRAQATQRAGVPQQPVTSTGTTPAVSPSVAPPPATASQPTPPTASPTGASFLQPPDANQGIYAIPTAPAGADKAAFRTETTKKAADEMVNDQQKGVGAIEFLQQADQARQLINDKGGVIGPLAQPTSETERQIHIAAGFTPEAVAAQFAANAAAAPADTIRHYLQDFRDLQAAVPTLTGEPNTFAQDRMDRRELNQMFTKLAQSGLKATYGSRVTNVDVNQQKQTVPTLTDTNAKESIGKLDTLEQQSWRTLNQNIKAGLLNPDAIPPSVAERGVAQGKFSSDVAAKFPAAQSKQLISSMPVQVQSEVTAALARAHVNPATPQGVQMIQAIVDEYKRQGSR